MDESVVQLLTRLVDAMETLAERLEPLGETETEADDGGVSRTTVVDALSQISTSLKYLGNGDAATPMGAIENLSKSVLVAGRDIAGSISELANAVDRLADR